MNDWNIAELQRDLDELAEEARSSPEHKLALMLARAHLRTPEGTKDFFAGMLHAAAMIWGGFAEQGPEYAKALASMITHLAAEEMRSENLDHWFTGSDS